jgi:protease-4
MFTIKVIAASLVVALAPLLKADDTPGDRTPKQQNATSTASATPPPVPTPVPVLVDMTLKGSISEDPTPIGFDGAPVTDNLKGLIDRIGRAKNDENVKGLLIRLRGLTVGGAKSNELRQAIRDFRSSGKKAFAMLELAQNSEYLVATAADEIVMPEGGWLMVKGLAAEVTFYRALFDKLGVYPDMMQIGEYKSAAEPYTRTQMSPAFREELTSLVTDSYDMLAEAIAKRQGIAIDEAKKLIDGGPYTPAAAKAAGLVNRIAYPDQLEAEIAKDLGVSTVRLDSKYGKKKETVELSGFAGMMKMMQALSGETVKKPESNKPKVAIIYASGMIMPGKSSSGGMLSGQAVMGSDTVIKQLRDAKADKTVKAIVLRVDSPGGSALASDLIWRETVRIGKPIVASMSDVAGSGGYYISVGCDKIFAEPGTITGSIGVVGGKMALGGLMDKVGITTDTITVGKNGTLFSTVKPFTDAERTAMRTLMEETYKQFLAKTARGRKMDVAQVEKLAAGRVYTGRQALRNGLIDELGTLDDAIAAAKELAGLDKGTEAELLILPKPKGVLESLVGPLEDRETLMPEFHSALPVPDALRAPLARLNLLTRLLATEPVLLVQPFEIRIR